MNTPIVENRLFSSFIEKEIRISKLELEEDMLLNDTDLTIKDLILHQTVKKVQIGNMNRGQFRYEVFKSFSPLILRYNF
jgi:hypothetical protein